MSDNVLVLHPLDALYAPADARAVAAALEGAGLVREPQAGHGDDPPGPRIRYRTGPAFEELVVFDEERRTSRSVLNDASRGPEPIGRERFVRDICELVVVGPLEREWFLAGASTEDPLCRRCGAGVDWNEIANTWIETWSEPSRPSLPEVPCASCARPTRPWDFDWRATAAFARFYLEIWHIHAGEAAPTEALLSRLREATGTPWSFLYYHL